MASATLAELKQELGGAEIGALSLLSDSEQARLRDSLRAAKRNQKQALDQAIEKGMGMVPALLRLPLKKILFP